MQLKAKIRNISREKRISAQVILQNYMMERLLERISSSPYKSSFILKGGMLISAMIGLESRTTMDIDATIRNHPLTVENILDFIRKDRFIRERWAKYQREFNYVNEISFAEVMNEIKKVIFELIK